jgi:hypothetical protein
MVEDTLAKRLRSSRAGAQHGDICDPATQERLRELVRSELKGLRGASTRETIMDVNPGGIPVRVNGAYPKEQPLSTVPPNLLRRLPRLPADIGYRFIGRHLVLRDARANLIIDYVLDIVPPA